MNKGLERCKGVYVWFMNAGDTIHAADVDWIIQILKRMQGQSFRSSFVISNFELGGSSAQHTQKAWKERYLVLEKHYGWLPNLFAHGWILLRRLLFKLHLLGK
jgi:hypothetical protein